MKWKKLLLTLISFNLFKVPGYTAKCAGHLTKLSRHSPWLQKCTIKQFNLAEWAQTETPPTLSIFPTRCPYVPLCGVVVVNTCRRNSLRIYNKPDKQNAEHYGRNELTSHPLTFSKNVLVTMLLRSLLTRRKNRKELRTRSEKKAAETIYKREEINLQVRKAK